MKLLDKLMGKETTKAVTPAAPNKEDGVYISRPVMNGKAWADWAASIGMPNPMAAADLHVTILASRIGVMKVPDLEIVQIMTAAGQFALMGTTEGVFAFVFDSWQLTMRQWDMQSAGAVSEWPMYTPHMSLSMNAPGFTPTPEQLQSAPQTVILGAETWGPFNPDVNEGDADDETEGLVDVELSALREHLKSGLLDGSLQPYDVAAIRSMTVSKRASASVLERYMPDVAKAKAKKAPSGEHGSRSAAGYADPGLQPDKKPRYPLKVNGEWNADHIRSAWSYINVASNQTPYSNGALGTIKDNIIAGWKAKIDPAGPPKAKDASKAAHALLSDVVSDPAVGFDVVKSLTLIVRGENAADQLPADVRKRLTDRIDAEEKSIIKSDDERREVWGWASVSHINDEPYTDLHGSQVTTKFLHDLCADMIKSQAGGDWEHSGPASNVLVGAIVFDKPLQKALGIDLGREGLFAGVHVPDDAGWEMAKSGDWQFSIAARCLVVNHDA